MAAAPPAGARRRRRDRLPRPRHPALRADRRRLRGGARARPRAQPAQHRADAARRPQAERAGHPDRGRLQPRLHRARATTASATFCSTGGASGWRRDCIVDPERGFFVDQRWMDLVPGLAEDFHLLRDPGFNVAYWNLRLAHARARAGRRRARRRRAAPALPLQRLPTPTRRTALSKHQDRIRLGDDPVLAAALRRLRAGAARRGLRRGVGLAVHAANTTRSGLPLDRTMRRRLPRGASRRATSTRLAVRRRRRARVPRLVQRAAPTRGGATASPATWRRSTTRGRTSQAAYPDLDDADVARGLPRLGRASTAPRSWRSPTRCCRPPPAAHAAPSRERRRPDACRRSASNVAGYLNAELGRRRGRAPGRSSALDANGVPLLPVGPARAQQPPRPRLRRARAQIAAPFAINLVCVNADGLPHVRRAGRPGVLRRPLHDRRLVVGARASSPTQWHGAFDLVDEIWAGSRFVADALSGRRAGARARHAAAAGSGARPSAPDRARFGLARTAFIFLFSFDYNSVFERKNPLGAVEAFTRAFGRRRACSSCSSASTTSRTRRTTTGCGSRSRAHPHVRLHRRATSTPPTSTLLTASCDAYVSLHRSEGFGIGMAEAMLLGKPVVATDYGGNTRLPGRGARLPRARTAIVPVGDDAWPYPPERRGPSRTSTHAARQMRAVVRRPRRGPRARRARRRPAPPHAQPATRPGARMARRLATIDGAPRRAAAADGAGRHRRRRATSCSRASTAARCRRRTRRSARPGASRASWRCG